MSKQKARKRAVRKHQDPAVAVIMWTPADAITWIRADAGLILVAADLI